MSEHPLSRRRTALLAVCRRRDHVGAELDADEISGAAAFRRCGPVAIRAVIATLALCGHYARAPAIHRAAARRHACDRQCRGAAYGPILGARCLRPAIRAGRALASCSATPRRSGSRPAAWLLLREPVPRERLAGIVLGLAGIAVMFNPSAFDWSNGNALIGSGLLLLAALCWAREYRLCPRPPLDLRAVSTRVLAGPARERAADQCWR